MSAVPYVPADFIGGVLGEDWALGKVTSALAVRFPLDDEGRPIYATGFVCSRGRRRRKVACAFCGAPDAGFLCDHPTGRKTTCDEPICGGCRVSIGPDRDLCPEHQRGRSQLELFGGTT